MNHLKKYFMTGFIALGFLFSMPPLVAADDNLNQLLIDQQQALPQEVLPSASLVVDANNGQILWEEKSETLIDPGFLTHLMTLYLAYDALKKGEIALTDKVTVEDRHQTVAQIPYLPSNNLITGVTYTVEDLIKLISFSNAVGASFLLAEQISDNAETFVTRMNETAEKLELTQTFFSNPSGISFGNIQGYDTWVPMTIAGNNQSTPKDLTRLAYRLIKDFPALLKVTDQKEVTVQAGGFTEETLMNQNPFIADQATPIPGTNGLLLDFSNPDRASGVITTTQGDLTLLTVLFDAGQNFFNEQGVDAFQVIGKNLIEQTFKKYEYRELIPAESFDVGEQTIFVETSLSGPIEKGTEPRFQIEGEKLVINNHLDFLFDSAADDFKVDFIKEESPLEKELSENFIVRFIMRSVEITQLTIFSIGLLIIGFLIFLMHFFIPRQTMTEPEEVTFDFETNEEVTPSRQDRRQKAGLPFRKLTFLIGLVLAGGAVLLLLLQYLF
ncbi:serine hydrolase [Enterococcus sp. LJL98]